MGLAYGILRSRLSKTDSTDQWVRVRRSATWSPSAHTGLDRAQARIFTIAPALLFAKSWLMWRLTATGRDRYVGSLWVLVSWTPSCMVSPTNGTTLCGTEARVAFRGYTLSANENVEVQASTNRRRFTTFATATTASRPTTVAGVSLYEWVTTAQVPAWASLRGTGFRTYVRGRTSGLELTTFDSTLPSGSTPEGCIEDRIAAGDSAASALATCSSAASPVVTLDAPTVSTCGCPTSHIGDVVIASASDAALWSCLQSLEGNLTVTSTAPSTVNLNSLETIEGELSLNYTTNGVAARTINLPVLQEVWGTLTIDGSVSSSPVALGLPELDWAVGDVVINLQNTSATRVAVTGLDDMYVIPIQYDFTFTSSGAFDSTNFMPNLVGAETMRVESTGLNPAVGLPLHPANLELVISLDIVYPSSLPPYPSFAHKQTVLFQNLELADYIHVQNDPFYAATSPVTFERVYPSLVDVGLLWLDGTQLSDLDIGASSIHVDALRLTNNPALTNLDPSALAISNFGSVNVHDNAALRQCEVNAFFSDLVTAGHTGTRASSGNNPAVCGACAGPSAHVGNLVIDTPEAATNARCIGSVSGDLIVAETPRTLAVNLPVLTSVAGSADISFVLRRDLTLVDRRTVTAPMLASVGTDLTLDSYYPDVPPAGANVGFNALTFVGGDIAVTAGHGPLQGLSGLTSLSGSLSLAGTGLDSGGSSFVPNLTTIGGTLHMEDYFAFINYFDSVVSVGGNVEVISVRLMGGLDDLTTVGGDLVLKPLQYVTPPVLATVGGSIIIDGTNLSDIDISAVAVTAAGLTINDNPAFATIDSGVTLVGSQPLTITNNSSLDTCAAETYAQAQVTNGHTGPVTISGNGGAGCP